MLRNFEKYPKYKNLYIRAFDKMLVSSQHKDYRYNWKTGQDVFDWWTGFDSDQMSLFESEGENI